MSALELQVGHGLDPAAAKTAEVQQGHMFGNESEPGDGPVVVSVAWSMTVSSWGHEAVIDHGSGVVTDFGPVFVAEAELQFQSGL